MAGVESPRSAGRTAGRPRRSRLRPAGRRLQNLVLAAAATGLALLTVAALLLVRAGAQSRPPVAHAAAAVASAPAACSSGTCYVAVSVATLWVSPSYPRPVDAPALANPARPARWVASMTTAQKQWLVGKLETQALYGTRVTVIGHSGTAWTKVAVPSQPTNRDTRGYPGWAPTRQLTRTAPAAAGTTAVITYRSAWLYPGWGSGGVSGSGVLFASYGTRLPVVRATSSYVEVTMIGGRAVALRRAAVVLHTAGTSWGATPARVVAEAQKFRGLGYLWAGTSSFGFDCSGFSYAVYQRYGVTLPRDADRQAVHGTAVARSALRPGDLVFFRGSASGSISHVGIYTGGGNMIDAPHTGAPVRVEPVSGFAYYAGARRYLG